MINWNLATWYFATDQLFVQRILATKSLEDVRIATALTGLMKIIPFFTIVLPGMISRIIFPDEVACTDPNQCLKMCGSSVSCYNTAYSLLILTILPKGLKARIHIFTSHYVVSTSYQLRFRKAGRVWFGGARETH